MRTVIVVALASLVGVRAAVASCGSAHTAMSPPTGARLPSHPTIYLFDIENEDNIYDSLAITRDGDVSDPVKFRSSKLSSGPAYTVHRIELFLLSARDRAISVRWHGRELAHYVIANDEIENRARVVDVSHERYAWTCSFADVVKVAVEGNAIAYQLQWDDDRTTVVADRELMWSGAASDSSLLEIGHPNCALFNVDPELLATSRAFELYALFADGSSKRLGSSILQLSEDKTRLPVELLEGDAVRLPRRFIVALEMLPPWVLAFGATGGLAGAVVVLLLVRRRARLRVHPSRVLASDADRSCRVDS